MKVYINGQYVAQEDAKVSVFDHGFLYGDGVFEGIRLYDGCIFKLDEHLERLEYSAKAIMLDMPMSREELAEITCESCRQNNITNGYIRLILSRGVGTLGLNPFECTDPQLIVIADSIQLYPEKYYKKGLEIITVATRRINPAALPPMIKSMNYLNNILAKIEAVNSGCMEALMLNDQGYVAECTGDNIFILSKGTLYTVPASSGALKGITRQTVIDISNELDVELVESNLTRYDIWNSDECFLTGSAAEIIPVVKLDGRTIGNGKPGVDTQRYMKAFQAKRTVEGTRI